MHEGWFGKPNLKKLKKKILIELAEQLPKYRKHIPTGVH
jgi:hypothetical protein